MAEAERLHRTEAPSPKLGTMFCFFLGGFHIYIYIYI